MPFDDIAPNYYSAQSFDSAQYAPIIEDNNEAGGTAAHGVQYIYIYIH
jgi:hypothetical protein